MVTKVTSKVIGSDVADVNLADGSVGTSELKTNSVTSEKILAGAVTTIKIIDSAVTSAKIAPAVIDNTHIAPLGVSTGNLANSAVTTIKITDSAVTEPKIGQLAVTAQKLADGAVITAKIGDDQVTRAKIAPNAVGQDEIQNNTVSLDKIAKGNQGAIPVAGANGDLAYLNPGAENASLVIKNGVPFWSTQVFVSGMIMDYAGITAPNGWVLANGMNIGNAASGANGRSNADCQTLFIMLWEAYPNEILPVSGGRGASAAADWAANKTIALPDLRGRVTVGRDEMGYAEAGRITSVDDADQVGSSGGAEENTIGVAQLPPHRHWTFANEEFYGSGYPIVTPYNYAGRSAGNDNYKYTIRSRGSTSAEPTLALSSLAVVNGTVQSSNNASPIDNMPPFMIMSKIMKL